MLKPTYDKKEKFPAFSKEVATCVGEVVQAAEVLKGGVYLSLRLLNQTYSTVYELRHHEVAPHTLPVWLYKVVSSPNRCLFSWSNPSMLK